MRALFHSTRLTRAVTVAALTLAAGCVDDPGAVTPSGARPAAFATPTPLVLATPRPADSPHVILPSPLVHVSPSPVPSPTPTPVGAETPATEAAAPSDDYEKTGRALDLAVSGPAYFVLATKAAPESVADLLFTRAGGFTIAKETEGALSLFRLRHGAHDFHAVGFSLSGAGETAPDEIATSAVETAWGAQRVIARGLSLDADRNAEAGTKLAFDYTGRLRLADKDPRDGTGAAMTAYVALASFERPESLQAQPGFAGVYRYRAEAGAMRLGVAVSGEGRALGSANLILTGTLERGD